ncbi:MAG: zinc metallopeptidase [Verrucomicrobiae bacterium]|nr:zinc metallopeptidase [Verrucomicrobiae bacterium]
MMILSLVLFAGTMIISLVAAARVKSQFHKYSRVPASSGYTGAEAAAAILRAAGIHDVQIYEHQELLGDHYDPTHKRLVLSSENYHGTSTAALGIAAHECGHAIQHQIAYAPLKMRMAAVGLTGIANQVVIWLPLIGLFGNIIPWQWAIMLMAVSWGVLMLFNLITLPVEFDASRRAKVILQKMSFIRPGAEATAVNKVLDAAAMTYVAAFITSLAYFLFYLLRLFLAPREEH